MRNAQRQPVPTDIRVMNAVAGLLVLVLLALMAGVAARWVARQPFFTLRAIQIEGDVGRNNAATLRANALPRLTGSFLSLNLQQARAAFESVPWVRHAVLHRAWPMLLKVRLEEHQPAAYWEPKPEGADADSDASVDRQLVNSFGETFQANLGDVEDEDLPTLSGPQGSAGRMLRMWQLLVAELQPLDQSVERLDLSGRGSWRATLDKGEVIEIGRGDEAEVQQRFARFVHSITQVTGRNNAPLLFADLRHPDGYAVRLRGVSTNTPAGKTAGRKN